MFEQTFVDAQARTRRPWTVAVSVIFQSGLVAVALIVPLLHPEALPFKVGIPVWAPLKPMTPPPPATIRNTRSLPVARPRAFVAPLQIPTHIARIVNMGFEAPEPSNNPVGGPPTFAGTGGDGIIGLPLNATVQPPPPVVRKAAPPTPAQPIHVGTGVQSAKLVFGPKPMYPPLARAARVQGVVRIRAVIGVDGAIRNLQVMGGPPLLVAVAMEAVKQWKYQPTLLNGTAVEVITEIDVNFTLSQ